MIEENGGIVEHKKDFREQGGLLGFQHNKDFREQGELLVFHLHNISYVYSRFVFWWFLLRCYVVCGCFRRKVIQMV